MTFIIAAANEAHTILVADRKVTRTGRKAGDKDVMNKVFEFDAADGEFAVAFTGLAEADPGFEMGKWLTDSLLECSSPDGFAGLTMTRLATKATRDFSRLRASRIDKRTTILAAGYRATTSEEALPTVGMVSNYEAIGRTEHHEAKAEFTFSAQDVPIPELTRSYVVTTGDGELDTVDIDALTALLADHSSLEAARGRTVAALGRVARRSAGSVSEECSSLVLPADGGPRRAAFHGAGQPERFYVPDVVIAPGGGVPGLSVTGLELVDEKGDPVPLKFCV